MTEPKYDVLERVPLPQIASAVRARAERVVAKWREAVKLVLPLAHEMTRQQIDNSIPKLLHELADALAADNPKSKKKLVNDAPAHGETRFEQHCNIDELLVEYDLLRRSLLEEVSHELKRDLSVQETIGLNSGIDIALREAAVEFCTHQEAKITAQATMMSKYLSFLSHDLRGNLNGAVLTIEVLRRDLSRQPEFSQSLEDIDVVKQSIFDAVATMDRFLHAEQLRRGKLAVKCEEVDLADLFRHVIRNVSQQHTKPGAAIASDVDGGLKCVHSDREALSMILSNLLSNAVKYAGDKSVRVTACKRDGGTRISVIDKGPGIAKDKIATLFAPFTRGETHGQRGVGLGLTIAQQTAELLGAHLHVESDLGKGASFHLDLPAHPKA